MTGNDKSTTDDSTPQEFQKPPLRPEPELTPEQIELIRAAEIQFEEMCEDRHKKGNAKYGVLTFLENPTLEMALEEIADLANYARYTFVKVVLLRHMIKQLQEQGIHGTSGFFTTEQILGVKKEV